MSRSIPKAKGYGINWIVLFNGIRKNDAAKQHPVTFGYGMGFIRNDHDDESGISTGQF